MRSIARDALFAYGSLVDGRAPASVLRALARHVIAAEEGWIAARLARTRAWYPAAVPDPQARLPGVIYHLVRAQALWPILDRYEGARRFGYPEFMRVRVEVQRPHKTPITAWAYLLAKSVSRKR